MFKKLSIAATLVLIGFCSIAQVTTPPGRVHMVSNSPTELRIRTPLYVINAGNRTLHILPTYTSGIIASTGIPNINNRWVQSIRFITSQDAVDQYGEVGRHGAVIVELKDDAFTKMPMHVAERFKEK